MLAIREGLKAGFQSLFGVLFGGVVVDVLYASLAFFGFSTFGGYTVFKLIALPVGASVFAFLAYSQIRAFFLKLSLKGTTKLLFLLFCQVFL